MTIKEFTNKIEDFACGKREHADINITAGLTLNDYKKLLEEFKSVSLIKVEPFDLITTFRLSPGIIVNIVEKQGKDGTVELKEGLPGKDQKFFKSLSVSLDNLDNPPIILQTTKPAV